MRRFFGKSVKRQITAIFLVIMIFMLLIFLIANRSFLEPFYIHNKTTEFLQVYEELSKAMDGKTSTDQASNKELSRLIESGNMVMMVLDERTDMVYSSTPNQERLRARLVAHIFGQVTSRREVLAQTKNYEIVRLFDESAQSEYIEMWGLLPDGNLFIIRSPIESIQISVGITNQFIIYVGIVVILVSALLVRFFSRHLTKPILELVSLSKKMTELDFDAQYTSGGMDEIGTLGEHFNVMSEKLEGTIKELKNANFELEKDIAQREKREILQSEFLANVSHELKTPIALIGGYAEGLREVVHTDEESRNFYCEVIIDETKKMNQLVRNLMSLNQLEFGGLQVEFNRFDISALVKGIVQSLDILIKQKEAKVHISIDSPLYVWGDEFFVEQALRNYITNAIYHVQGSMEIEIKGILVSEEKVRISVFNTGEPIPEEDVSRIWDKFYKVDKAHSREYGGNGIGLSIVKAIMDAFSQDYGLQNYDNGVEFWFQLDAR